MMITMYLLHKIMCNNKIIQIFGDNRIINNAKCIIGSVNITVFNIRWARCKLASVINSLIPLVCQEFCRVNSVLISPAIHICSAFCVIHNV